MTPPNVVGSPSVWLIQPEETDLWQNTDRQPSAGALAAKSSTTRTENIGLILPASVGGALANIATLLAGKVPVNLNFTTGREAMDLAIEQSNLHTILTSRTFLAKAKIDEHKGMVFVEDLLKDISSAQRVWTAIVAFLTPTRLLQRLWNRPTKSKRARYDHLLQRQHRYPKGVMLSHHNILSNVESMQQIFTTSSQDCVMGALPFFHSFGFHRHPLAPARRRMAGRLSSEPA